MSVDDSIDAPGDADTDGLPADHWVRAKPVFDELGTITSPNGEITLQTIGEHGRYGWYRSRPAGEEDIERGYAEVGAPWLLPDDYDALTDAADRDIYAVINYLDPETVREHWKPYRWSDGNREWKGGESPLPRYADLVAMAPFADIDLHDERKSRPLDAETQQVVEDTLAEYIGGFAELAGGREHVFALDSVGGAYVFVAPASTVKIGAAFRDDPDARGRILDEFTDRMNEWLGDLAETVNEEIPDAVGLFEPDALNNKNRLYKAPLSPHADITGIVHPIDTAEVEYNFVPFDAVGDTLVDETREWAAAFTDPEHRKCISSIVETLWPAYSAEHDSWHAALDSWVADERAEEQEREDRRRAARERRAERADELPTDLSEQPLTTSIEDVFDAVDDIDIRPVIKRHCAEWEPTGRTDHLNPGSSLWKESDSGTSCFVNPSKNIFVDIGDPGGKGGPAKFIGLKEGLITSPDADLSGERYWQAVDALRDEGYDIPILVPEAGSPTTDGETFEKTPLWALRNAAVALDVLPTDGFIEKPGDDGGSYLDFPGPKTRGAVLAELDELEIDHGWEDPTTTGGSSRYSYDLDHPVYELLPPEEGDVELHLVPLNGTSVGVEITQNGKMEYSEVLNPGFWNNRTIRDRVASEVSNTLTGVDQANLKRAVKDALTQVGVDEREKADEFEVQMRSEREQTLRDRTERVVCHPTADSAEWIITMRPPAESPVTEPRELSLSEGDLNDSNAGAFRNAHLAKFFAKVEIDSTEWSNLTDHWLEQQVTDDYEPNLELEAAVEKFCDWVSNLRVWADEAGFSWSSLHGFYVEGYHEDEDAVLVSGQKVNDWRAQENIDPDLNLSKELRERGIMLRTTTPTQINGKRRRAWPVAADITPHTPETALEVDSDGEGNDDDDHRPGGLR